MIAPQKIVFVSLKDLVEWTSQWTKMLPTDFDVVVGIPRSGLLVAIIIALKLAKPLTTPQLFREGLFWNVKSGDRKEIMEKMQNMQRVLLVDDTVSSGGTMNNNVALLLSIKKKLEIVRAALIVAPLGKDQVDLYYKVLPAERFFEWGLTTGNYGRVALDMDGVICEDCPDISNPKEYLSWIKNAKPNLIPMYTIEAIVSNRLEKYRKETEEWLSRHKVHYKMLLLAKTEEDRGGRHKIEALIQLKPTVFIESDVETARQIWETTKIPTLCLSKMVLFS